MKKYAVFLPSGNDISHSGLRLGSLEMLRADLPEAAIVPADEVPANWKEMSVQNGQLVPASAEVLAARRQLEAARIQQEMGLNEQEVPGEYFLDRNGNKKQVYTKTILATVPENKPWLVSKAIEAFVETPVFNIFYSDGSNQNWTEIMMSGYVVYPTNSPSSGGFYINMQDDYLGKLCLVKLKYIKP